MPLELGILALGFAGSCLVAHQIALRERTVAWPWYALCAVLTAAAIWMLSQPMEMRGTFLS